MGVPEVSDFVFNPYENLSTSSIVKDIYRERERKIHNSQEITTPLPPYVQHR